MAMTLRDIIPIRSFDDAARVYAEAHCWKDIGDAVGVQRALGRSHKRYLAIVPVEHGYACLYHGTRVVTWRRKDNRDLVTVRGWRSLSTAALADACTPWSLGFIMHLEEDDYYARATLPALKKGAREEYRGWAHAHEARCYAFRHEITFEQATPSSGSKDGDEELDYWLPVNHTYKATFIDGRSPLLRAALLKTRYFEFCTWLDAVMTFDQMPTSMQTTPHKRQEIIAADDALTKLGWLGLLQDVTNWLHLVNTSACVTAKNCYSTVARREAIKRELRESIYKKFDAVLVRKVDWYDWGQFVSQRKLRQTYEWAI